MVTSDTETRSRGLKKKESFNSQTIEFGYNCCNLKCGLAVLSLRDEAAYNFQHYFIITEVFILARTRL